MRTVRGIVLVAMLAGAAAFAVPSPVGADGGQEVPYTCDETSATLAPDSLAAPLPLTASDSVDPAKIYQPVTSTATIGLPDIALPEGIDKVDFRYFRVRLPIPANVEVSSARAVAPTGQTPNPPLASIAVTLHESEILVELPKPSLQMGFGNRIRATAGEEELTYPENIFLTTNSGDPVVLPVINVAFVPLPAAGGTTVSWDPPRVDTEIDLFSATYSCDADDPAPSILDTAVTNATQLCDGQPVTVQVGFNSPTAAADVIQGTAGNDPLRSGLGGNDRYCGLAGNDRFAGGGGNDRAIGGAGSDNLKGDAGMDNLQGGPNNDTLNGGPQRDTCAGSTGTDTATACEVRTGIP